MSPVLSVRGLEKRFGAVVAADALSIDIAAGQKEFARRALLNGAATTGRYAPEMESRAA